MPKNEKQALLDALEHDDYDAFLEEKVERVERENKEKRKKPIQNKRIDKRNLYE